MSKPITIVFDLDDTLVKEIDYLKSAFGEIASFADSQKSDLLEEMLDWHSNKENVFGKLEQSYPHATVSELKKLYRNHLPDFSHVSEVREFLSDLKSDGHFLGLITDGFSVTQRNKINALGIEDILDLIVISEEFGSEKPHESNYSAFHKFNTENYLYVGDNLNKDFVTAKKLGWTTICLIDDGRNVHAQDFNRNDLYLPAFTIHSLDGLSGIIKNLTNGITAQDSTQNS
ncbi:HAD family hydrolase [Flavobacterium sp.]|uniref:HAD family hydrolase n=1 Tax=Flavobacterium sp. TaxID=239 RepID=UPI00121704D3|nr:HAD family hydrolase [Flavobacterium sp.]RZJ70849.1 MAG: HAD family hydrolase [Flavobacterium sp.]